VRPEVSAARLLVLAPFPPRLDGLHGGSRAIAQLHVRLAALHPVTLVHLRAPHEAPVDDVLRRSCALVREVIMPRVPDTRVGRGVHTLETGLALLQGRPMWVARTRSRRFAAAVRAVVAEWQPQVVQFEYHVMGQYLEALDGSRIRTVLRQLEPGAAAAQDRVSGAASLGRAARVWDSQAWRRYERDLLDRVDAVVALTQRDAGVMRELAPRARIVRIPLGAGLPPRPADPAGAAPPGLLFVGNFMHPPNVTAAVRLADRILPRIRLVLPDARLTIVGPHPPATLRAREPEGVIATGEVPDVHPYLDAAAVVVAPLDLGGGMRIKVTEALAAGKALVASPLAVEGLDATPGEQYLLAESDDEIVESCLALLRDPALRVRLANGAREWSVRHLGWDGPVAAYERLYASLTG
jgi:polysaccharide biosynthesis protein PslH